MQSSVLRRVLLILAASSAILALAVYQGKAIVGRSFPAYQVASGPALIEPAAGSVFIRSYPVICNGVKTTFAHYTSRLKAEGVVKEYQAKAGGTADASADGRKEAAAAISSAHLLSSRGAGCSAMSYMTNNGTVVGVVAFDNPKSGGSEYFVGAFETSDLGRAGRRMDSDPERGREPPGVPKPPRSTRTFCIENLGGVASVLVFYEALGNPGEIVEDLRHNMAEADWAEHTASSGILTMNYEGRALISFSRGHEQCIVGVDHEPKSGKIVVVVFWADRPWLPTGTAL